MRYHLRFIGLMVLKTLQKCIGLTLIGMSSQSKKNAHLLRQLGVFSIRPNELGRAQMHIYISHYGNGVPAMFTS
jgi:hypothetical protein